MPSPILARADALMQRRRQGHAESTDLPTLTDAIGDDDIPVLVDAETHQPSGISARTDETAAGEQPLPEMPLPFARSELREEIARDLALQIEHRILAALPRLIDEAVTAALAELNARDEASNAS